MHKANWKDPFDNAVLNETGVEHANKRIQSIKKAFE